MVVREEQRHEELPRTRPRRVLAVTRQPHRPRPRRRRFHIAALFAAAVYFGAAFVAYELFRSAWFGETPAAAVDVDEAAAEAEPAAAPAASTRDRAAMRALAAGAQQSVYVVEGGGGRGSGFVAWTSGGNSYVIGAYRTFEPMLTEGGRTVFVRRGSQFWTGSVVRAHKANGLVLIRVDTLLERPLWQQRRRVTKLRPGATALVVPAGPDAPVGEGTARAQARGRVPVQAPVNRLNVGAPVLDADGGLAGVVTETRPAGINLVVPIEGACEAGIRRCG
jgi:hypothetical protein